MATSKPWRPCWPTSKRKGSREIYCLGDIVGYGPNPRECIDLVMQSCQLTILGNHDQGAMFDPDGFNPPAERAIFWTRDQLESPDARHRQPRKALGLPGRAAPQPTRRPATCSSTARPATRSTNTSSPKTSTTSGRWSSIFALVEQVLLPGAHARAGRVHRELAVPQPRRHRASSYKLDGRKTLCNVGSVGQPRDGDRRACYVIFDDESINFRRVEYPVEVTRDKIYAIPELDNLLGERIMLGR